MNVAVDIDGTLNSFPREFQTMMSAFTAAGHHVYVITGTSESQVTQDDIDAKREYLTALGIGRENYYELIVCPEPTGPNKAQAIQDNEIAVLFDNKVANVKAAKPYCAALLLWNSREKE